MASINFPDPLTQTPPNTFSPTSTPESTSNGTTYVWDGNVWRVSGSSVFVNTTGDNMTGDLTLGTDKITLNATDGSITAAGNIISGLEPGQGLNDGVKLGKTGFISLSRTDPTGNVFNVTTTGNANKLIQMTAGGTAYFAGDTGIGGTPGTAGGAAPVPNITLDADGSASFASGNFTVNTLGGVNQYARSLYKTYTGDAGDNAIVLSSATGSSRYGTWYANGDMVIGGTIGGNGVATDNANITLAADGSITAAGEITGSAINGGSGDNTGRIGANGSVIIDRDPGSGVNFIVGRQSGVQQFAVTGGGSANFAGDLISGDYDNGAGVKVNSIGLVHARKSSFTTPTHTVLNGTVSTVEYSFVSFPTGTSDVTFGAKLDGTVVIGGTIPSAPNITLNANGSVRAASAISFNTTGIKGSGQNALVGYGPGGDSSDATFVIKGSGTTGIGGTQAAPNITLDASGAASFAGGVVSISGSGAVNVNRNETDKDCFSAQLNGTTKVLIRSSGDASFAGTVQSTNFATNSATGKGWQLGVGGAIVAQRNDNVANPIFRGYFGKAENFTVTAGGAATFSGKVTASNVTFNLEADDATKYTSTTDADGVVTSVYNGATLDMKEVGLALVALKTAAAAASDFTTLKSAIATALANI